MIFIVWVSSFWTLRVIRRHIVYLTLSTIAAFSSLVITKDRDVFFSYPVRIETLSIAFPVFMLNSARAVDRFSAVFSVSAKSLAWRNICYSSF